MGVSRPQTVASFGYWGDGNEHALRKFGGFADFPFLAVNFGHLSFLQVFQTLFQEESILTRGKLH